MHGETLLAGRGFIATTWRIVPHKSGEVPDYVPMFLAYHGRVSGKESVGTLDFRIANDVTLASMIPASDEIEETGGHRGFPPVGGVQLAENAGHVALHRAGADEQPLRDFRIGQAQTDQAQHLALAPGQEAIG